MSIHSALRRLTIKALDEMRKETGTADFRSETNMFRFSVNELSHFTGISPAKVLKELDYLIEIAAVRKFKEQHQGKKRNHQEQLWQLMDIEDVVTKFYQKLS